MPKTNTLTTLVADMRDELSPHYEGNVDPMIFDYDFFTNLERLAKREREKAKTKLIDYADKPDDVEGTIVETDAQAVELTISKPPEKFNEHLFIEKLVLKYDIPRQDLIELKSNSMETGTGRKTYKVVQK